LIKKAPGRSFFVEEQTTKNKLTANIYGHKYTIMGDATPDYLEKVANYVNTKMNEIGKKRPILDTTRISVLTAINIADEYFRLKEDYDALLRKLEEQTKE
jgi:cell division protein ZapA